MKRLLHVTDASYGFMEEGCDLPVGADGEGAMEIAERTNAFFSKIPVAAYDAALFTLDTHFKVEYPLSYEADAFPLHCEYGTRGWALAVDPGLIHYSIPKYYVTKNVFDFWGENPVAMDTLLERHGAKTFEDLPFESAEERTAYANLYHITSDPKCLQRGTHRDVFMQNVDADTTVDVIGVASNFCDADAIYGYLQKGASVNVFSDLVKGIPLGAEGRQGLLDATGIDRTEGGTIEEVLKTDRFKPFVESGKLRLWNSDDYLKKQFGPQGPANNGIGDLAP